MAFPFIDQLKVTVKEPVDNSKPSYGLNVFVVNTGTMSSPNYGRRVYFYYSFYAKKYDATNFYRTDLYLVRNDVSVKEFKNIQDKVNANYLTVPGGGSKAFPGEGMFYYYDWNDAQQGTTLEDFIDTYHGTAQMVTDLGYGNNIVQEVQIYVHPGFGLGGNMPTNIVEW